VVKGMSLWLDGWIKKNWLNSRKEPVFNRDLWEQLKPDPPPLRASLPVHTGDSQVGMELSEAAIVAAAQGTMPPERAY